MVGFVADAVKLTARRDCPTCADDGARGHTRHTWGAGSAMKILEGCYYTATNVTVNMQPRGQCRNRRGDFDSHRGRDDNRLKDRGKQTQLLDGGERNQRACIRNDGHSEGPAVFDFSTKIFLAQLQVWNAPRRGMTNEVAARPPTRDCTPVNSIDRRVEFHPRQGLERHVRTLSHGVRSDAHAVGSWQPPRPV